jgi:hypothetical protein
MGSAGLLLQSYRVRFIKKVVVFCQCIKCIICNSFTNDTVCFWAQNNRTIRP